MGERSALLLIDLQNDFLSPTGIFGNGRTNAVLENCPDLFKNIETAVARFSKLGHEIVWITSDYSKPEGYQSPAVSVTKETYLTGSHMHSPNAKPCCIPGTDGIKLDGSALKIREIYENSHDVVKKWYSAFTETELNDFLLSKNVQKLYLAGLTATTCVLATAAGAQDHGFEVQLIEDCVAAKNSALKKRGLDEFTKSYGEVCTLADLVNELSTTNDLRDSELSDDFGNNERADETSFKTSGKKSPHLKGDIACPISPQMTNKPDDMILYWVNGSIPSWRVMLALCYKKIPHQLHRLRVMSTPKETRSAAFKAINPRGKTPTLIDTDGTVVIESLAILEYLETFGPQNLRLVPDKADKAAYALVVQRFHESENIHNVCEDMELLYLKEPLEHKAAILKSYKGTLEELVFWETYVKCCTYVAGENFTLADCAFYPILAYLVHRGLKLQIAFPSLDTYYKRISAMDCTIAARPINWNKLSKVNIFAGSKILQKERQEISS